MAAALRAAFDVYDRDSSGELSRAELRHVLADPRASLAPRMARLIMALLNTPSAEQVSFDDFCATSLRVLSEQFQLELRAAAGGALEARLLELAGASETGEVGVLSRAAAIDLLLAQDVLTISRVQATAIVGQLNAQGGPVHLVRFVPMACAVLRALGTPASAAERARMLARADFAPLELMGGREREALSDAFAAAFAKHDLDSSQTLVRARERCDARRCALLARRAREHASRALTASHSRARPPSRASLPVPSRGRLALRTSPNSSSA
jgi:hypothetical protein